MIFKKRDTCRVCAGALSPILSLGDQYLVRFPEKLDETLPKAPLSLMQCQGCNLLQLEHTTNPDLLFREFWYRSSVNQTMRDALQDVVDDALRYVRKGTWLDIGANDGFLLSCLPEGWTKIACEPALNFKPMLEEHADHVIADYFSSDHDCLKDKTRGACDVITSVACFYDVDDPNQFVSDIVKALAPGGVWINQLNDSPTMLKANAFDSICHEHLAYYDIHTLAELYRRHGLIVSKISFNDINGGSIRVFAHKEVSGLRSLFLGDVPKCSPEQAQAFAKRTVRWKQEMGNLLSGIKGGIYGYGASTKGAVLLQYLDCDDMFIAVADRNPLKWGKLMVGSWIPIVDEAMFRKARPSHALVLPWAFANEFSERETEARAGGTAFVWPLPEIRIEL
jgi:NDP-4-keto-2,6-dideoxyhexose 3-C-methyltransferase